MIIPTEFKTTAINQGFCINSPDGPLYVKTGLYTAKETETGLIKVFMPNDKVYISAKFRPLEEPV